MALFDALVGYIQSPVTRSRQGSNSRIERLIIVDKNPSLVNTLKSVFASKSANPIFSPLFQPRVDGNGVLPNDDHVHQQRNAGARPKSHRRQQTSRRNRHHHHHRPGLNQNGNSGGMAIGGPNCLFIVAASKSKQEL